MKFQDSQPIFMQIVDWLSDKVLVGELKVDEQFPSVRDIAAQVGVNPNTVMRAIERLLQAGIIYSQRGKGNYVAEGARDKILQERRQRFFCELLPQVTDEMLVLGLTLDDVVPPIQSALAKDC